MRIDRNIHIYCYGKGCSLEMAHQAQEHEHGDFEVGAIRCGSMLKPSQESAAAANTMFLQKTVKFINDEASSVHGALRVGSLYTGESGEWKVGGFEVLSSMKDDEAIIYVRLHFLKNPGRFLTV